MGGGNKGSTSGTSGGYSWAGGNASKFDAEGFNNMLGSDMARAYKQGPAATYDKSLYTGMGETTNEGMGGLLDAARDPAYSGYLSGAMDSLGAAASGNFGDDPVRQRLRSDVLADVGSQFTSTQRFGGGSHVDRTTDRLVSSLGEYDNNRQMSALAALPGIYQASLQPSQTILGVGQAQDADAQAKRLADYELFQRRSDPAYQHLAKYQGLLGAQSAGPQPEQQPGLFDWLGLGISAAGTFL